MRFVGAVKGRADPLGQVAGGQQAVGFDDPALAVDPLRLDRVQPRRLERQVAVDDPDPAAEPLDGPIVLPDPGADRLADVPGGIVPDQQQGRLAGRLQLGTAPGQELGRDPADRPPVDEPQPGRLVRRAIRPLPPADQQPVAGQRLGVGVILRDRLLDQPQRPVQLGPGVQGRARQATPPDLVLESEDPVGVADRQADQAVARTFFRAYSGSGLVIHCLARRQRTPSRWSVARIVSPLTRSAVRPCSKLTSAANSKVQTLVGLSNVRGLWCSRARNCSARAASKATWLVCGQDEPRWSTASPTALKPLITLRTVWSSQPRAPAIAGARSPRALARMIWQRRRTKASAERR